MEKNIWRVVIVYTLICSSVWSIELTHTYSKMEPMGIQAEIGYVVDGDYIYFLIVKNAGGHLCFGVGRSMAEADILVASKDQSGVVTLETCSLVGLTRPRCTSTSSRWSWAASRTQSVQSTPTYLMMEVKRRVRYSEELQILEGGLDIVDGKNYFIYSYSSSNTLRKHDFTGDNDVKKVYVKLPSSYASSRSYTYIIWWLLYILVISH